MERQWVATRFRGGRGEEARRTRAARRGRRGREGSRGRISRGEETEEDEIKEDTEESASRLGIDLRPNNSTTSAVGTTDKLVAVLFYS